MPISVMGDRLVWVMGHTVSCQKAYRPPGSRTRIRARVDPFPPEILPRIAHLVDVPVLRGSTEDTPSDSCPISRCTQKKKATAPCGGRSDILAMSYFAVRRRSRPSPSNPAPISDTVIGSGTSPLTPVTVMFDCWAPALKNVDVNEPVNMVGAEVTPENICGPANCRHGLPTRQSSNIPEALLV